MTKLSLESAKAVIDYNRSVLYHLPAKYKYLNLYLQGSLRETLFSVYKFIYKRQILIINHKYIFFVDNSTLTYKVRKKICGKATSSRHMNLLCAIGLFTKQYQSRYKNELIEININFFEKNPDRLLPINVYSFRKYSSQELERLEQRAKRLAEANITTGNFCQSILTCHDLGDLTAEVLPNNSRKAPEKKFEEFQKVLNFMLFAVDEKGFVTRQEVKDNLVELSDKELDKLFRIFKQDIAGLFFYKRPTKAEIHKYKLYNLEFIYTEKSERRC